MMVRKTENERNHASPCDTHEASTHWAPLEGSHRDAELGVTTYTPQNRRNKNESHQSVGCNNVLGLYTSNSFQLDECVTHWEAQIKLAPLRQISFYW